MRLKLILQHPPGAAIPINYAYFISAWIYKIRGLVALEEVKKLELAIFKTSL